MDRIRRLGVPLLACGQTIFWDEPVKVVLREILDILAPEVRMFLGIHDTDYFSRGAPAHLAVASFETASSESHQPRGPETPDSRLETRNPKLETQFVALPHNDFSTRGLWAAAGEISLLFGGEVVPSQEDFAQVGVSLEKAARAAKQTKTDFLNAMTEAWGWRGLVCLATDHPVAGQMPLAHLRQPLLKLLRWAFNTSANFLASEDARERARQVEELITGWVEERQCWAGLQVCQGRGEAAYPSTLGRIASATKAECLAPATPPQGRPSLLRRSSRPVAIALALGRRRLGYEGRKALRYGPSIPRPGEQEIQPPYLSGKTTLSAFYKQLLPRFCSLLLGREAENLHFFTSSEFFQFNSATACRPRFAPLSLFLNPDTATGARWAYDSAVRGSGIYELAKFGPGAIPFDLVAPGRGRGTLFITPSSVRVGFESGEVIIPTCRPLSSPAHLASVLEDAFGKEISLVGKATVLPLMFSTEFIMVLHQGASVYIPLTKKMYRLLHQQGLALHIHPILRLRYHTWSSLSATGGSFKLPPHLASAFQTELISAREFAATWEEVVARQGTLLEHLRQLKTPEELFAYLSTRDAVWKAAAQEWGSAHRTLHEIGQWVKCYKMQADSLSAAVSSLNAEVAELENRKGALKRQKSRHEGIEALGNGSSDTLQTRNSKSVQTCPTPCAPSRKAHPSFRWTETDGLETGARHELTARIRACRATIRQKKAALGQVLAALERVEHGEQAVAARKTIARLEAEAELARAYLARDALLVQGLTRANLRPTAWWFPLVDRDSHWFRQLVRTTELSFEEFDAD